MMMVRKTATVVVLALAATGMLQAQALYLSAEPEHPDAGEEIRVRLMSGAPFDGQATETDSVRIQRLWNAGRTLLDDETGSAAFRPDSPGVELIASLAGDDEVSSFGKALLVVGEPSRSGRIWRSELGQRLEIVPETDPLELARRGGALQIQVLFDREPLSGATVVAVAEEAGTKHYRQGQTDEMGRVRFELDRPGRWLVHLAHKSFEQIDDRGWTLYQSSLLLAAGP
jgi:hypothetical protein